LGGSDDFGWGVGILVSDFGGGAVLAAAGAGNLRIASGQGFVVLFTCHFYFAAALA
jgi:hypothetical protein